MIVGGGFKAIRSVLRYAITIGPLNLYRAVTSKNACKACAFGTGGQQGGYRNEQRTSFELCNKNIQAHLSDIRPGIDSSFFLANDICGLSTLSGRQLEGLGRLVTPLYKRAGDSHYSPITYEKAIDITRERLQATQPQRSFFYASGRSSNEAAFSLQLMARIYGTNNINNCSYYCHQASGVALTATVGTSTATVTYADLDRADLIFVFGANPASNHPRFVKTLIQARRRGAKVVVVNPAKEAGMVRFAAPSDIRSMLAGGADVASHYVQPHLGGDLAFMQGVAKVLIDENALDHEFLHSYATGYSNFSANIQQLDWRDIERESGVSKSDIVEVALLYAKSKNTIFTWSMGLTHHRHGVANIETLAALAAMRGMLGKPGAGLLPLRGHSNIQGTGSMGFTPALKSAVEQKIEAELGTELPKETGLDTMACMHAAHSGDMDVAVMLGGNLLASNPDTVFATEALNTIPFKCFISTTLNMSHVAGVDGEVLVLPVRARDEETQATTQESMFNFVRLSDGGITRFAQLWSEIDIICSLGEALISKEKLDFSMFRTHERVRKFVAKVVPGFDLLAKIDASKHEFHIDGRILHQPKFNTPDNRVHLNFHQKQRRDPQQLMLTTVRSEGQFNSIIYHEHDSYRGQNRRDVVMMSVADMHNRSLRDGDLVNLTNTTGTMKNLTVRGYDIRQGNIMVYYPEANVLVPKETDDRSFTPAFKSVPVDVVRLGL